MNDDDKRLIEYYKEKVRDAKENNLYSIQTATEIFERLLEIIDTLEEKLEETIQVGLDR